MALMAIEPRARETAAREERQMFQLIVRYPDGKQCLSASGVFKSEKIEKAFWKWFNAAMAEKA